MTNAQQTRKKSITAASSEDARVLEALKQASKEAKRVAEANKRPVIAGTKQSWSPNTSATLSIHQLGARILYFFRSFCWVASTLLVSAAFAQEPPPEPPEGVRGNLRKESRLAKLVPAEIVEAQSIKNYREKLAKARQANALASDNHGQLVRLRAVAERILPFAGAWNSRAVSWNWEVNLIVSDEINAFCMAGGKIAFYTGILYRLQLSDDEVAAVMGHEIAHALREHSRKHLAEGVATGVGAKAVGKILGDGQLSNKAADYGAKLLSLKFNRNDELDADLVGIELAARAGYDPRAGISLWRKMMDATGAAQRPPEYRSTHPSGDRRIQQIATLIDKVMPLYEKADKPSRVYGPASAP